MLSIQEMVQKSEDQLKNVKHLLNAGYFHPSEASILGTLEHPQKLATKLELEESLRKIPLREFLAKSGTSGLAGAAYLVPDKLHVDLIAATYQSDKVPLFAAQVVNGWAGGDLLVDIAVRQSVGGAKAEGGKWSLYPKKFSSGGAMAQQTVETVKATLSPISFSVPFHIGTDLVEDAGIAPDIIQWHVNHAAQQIGQYATDLAITDLKAASDGDGTQCAVDGGANTTTSANILEALREVGSEFWNPNTMIVTHEAWGDAITVTASHAGVVLLPPAQGYDAKFQMLDTIFNNSSSLCADVTSGKMTLCVTMVLDRTAALLCGRKRWLKLENYSNPVADLSCVVVSCRQDCVTLYKDASCEVTEASE